MSKAMAQMSAGFAKSPEEKEKFNQIAGRRERGLGMAKARTDKFWADKNAKDEAERLEQLRAKYAGVDIDAEIARLKPAIQSAYHEFQYGARNTYGQGRDDYNRLMAQVQELERAKAALAKGNGINEGSSDLIGNAIEDLRASKPGMDQETFLDELYFYIDAEWGKNAADQVSNARQDDWDDWYYSYNDGNEGVKLSELSNELLGAYKKAAGISARDLDKAGKYKQADKRFHGIVQATKKELDNDMKKHQQDEMMETRINMMRKAGYDL
jgi:hypothetical protein